MRFGLDRGKDGQKGELPGSWDNLAWAHLRHGGRRRPVVLLDRARRTSSSPKRRTSARASNGATTLP